MNISLVNNFKSKISIDDLNSYTYFNIEILKAIPIFLKTYNPTYERYIKRETNWCERKLIFKKRFNKLNTFLNFIEKVNSGCFLKIKCKDKVVYYDSVFSFKQQCNVKFNTEI